MSHVRVGGERGVKLSGTWPACIGDWEVAKYWTRSQSLPTMWWDPRHLYLLRSCGIQQTVKYWDLVTIEEYRDLLWRGVGSIYRNSSELEVVKGVPICMCLVSFLRSYLAFPLRNYHLSVCYIRHHHSDLSSRRAARLYSLFVVALAPSDVT